MIPLWADGKAGHRPFWICACSRLTGLERDKIEAEYQELLKQIEYFRAVLANERMVLDDHQGPRSPISATALPTSAAPRSPRWMAKST